MLRSNPGTRMFKSRLTLYMSTLYVIGTPIGNLEDLTFRAARVLGEVSLVAAEDTRVTGRLLRHLNINVRMVSYNEHNQARRLPLLLEALAAGDVALVTDAGTPGVSDPGSGLVAMAATEGHRVEAVPGVSAVTAALSVSGMPADRFRFLGFLPRRSADRRARLAPLAESQDTLVLFEAPHRLQATLADLLTMLGDREVAVGRELTKLHEEVFRGPVSRAIAHFAEPRGEFAIVVRGASPHALDMGPDEETLAEASQRLRELRAAGVGSRDAVAQVSEALGIPRNTVYRLWIESERDG